MRVYDSVLVEELNYKAILISEETTVEDVIRSAQHFPIYGHLGVRLRHTNTTLISAFCLTNSPPFFCLASCPRPCPSSNLPTQTRKWEALTRLLLTLLSAASLAQYPKASEIVLPLK